jgi:glycosyltransferase involved in cell wall biosynthesis
MPHAVFLINLLQDVSTVRPLVFMAGREFGFTTELMLTEPFSKRDASGTWRLELQEIAAAAGATLVTYAGELEAWHHLQGKQGLLFAGSESNLGAHSPTHDLFRIAPSSFVTVTLQHGLECVGFLQSRDHDRAHGREVAFAADIICAWCAEGRLTALAPSQRSKLHVTGPSSLLQQRPRGARGTRGIVCENLHSVRMQTAGEFRTDFVDVFRDFCQALAAEGREVVLRPHPGGQYVLKKAVPLPANVTLNNSPIYKVDLAGYAYGISAPSSMLIDMVLAGIPTAVWRDPDGVMDAANYRGLTEISSGADWITFSREATLHPERFIEAQRKFLERLQMPLDPADIYRRFAALFAAALRMSGSDDIQTEPAEQLGIQTEPAEQLGIQTAPAEQPGIQTAPAEQAGMQAELAERHGPRVMFIANSFLATLQLSFFKPLQPMIDAGTLTTGLISEQQMTRAFGENVRARIVHDWVDDRLDAFAPTIIVFCRYSGPHAEYVTAWAGRRGIPTVYHVDDDLLSIPLDLGKAKYEFHNHPLRLAAVRHLLAHVDVLYCSTSRLQERLQENRASGPTVAGRIYASGTVLAKATLRPVRKVGYMANTGHTHDLRLVLPAIVQFLRRNPHVHFELFGSIPRPPELEEFGERFETAPQVQNYAEFLSELAKRQWDVGICPLLPTPFNLVKANTKWVEYTSVGAAVVASRATVYDECCADDCGLLADTIDEWVAALETLVKDPAARFAQATRAQDKLNRVYSPEGLRAQVLDVFAQAQRHRQPSHAAIPLEAAGRN